MTRQSPVSFLPFRLSWLLIAAVAGLARAADTPAPAEPAPLQSFFRHADIDDVRLSPSGRWLALTTGTKSKRMLLAVVDLEGKVAPTVAASYSDADVRSFDWVNDDRLVYNVIDLAEALGTQEFGPGLFSTRRDGSETRQLIEARARPGVSERQAPGRSALAWNHRLLSIPAGGGDEVIVGQYQFDNLGELSAVSPGRMNVVTGRFTSLAAGRPDHTMGWWFDAEGAPRVAESLYQGQIEFWWRDAGEAAWRSLAKFPANSIGFAPRFIDAAGTLFVTSPSSRGNSVLKRFDFAAKRPEREAIVSTPGFDFTGSLLTDNTRSKAYGVRVETDAETTVWFEPAMQVLQKRVDERFPGRINELVCHRCADPDVVLVHSFSDQDPGSYWVYRPPTDAWQPVGKVRNDIDPRAMAQVDFKRIKARDGQDLPVWVTARPAAKGAPPRPAVVLVHGGPWLRGTVWRLNPEAQFLASRGYVVIEPEFRGSTGFGAAHFKSGWKQWGGTMQDDVADATRWAANQGLIDPKRTCIAGASYGGYATLMGLVRDPDLYRCGVAWVGVTDPRLLFESSWASDSDEESRKYSLPQLIGDPQKDAAALARAAPVERAGEIRAPLLLAYGGEDRRVPLEHGKSLRAALRAAGHEPEWIVYSDEGHGWLKPANEFDFWQRVERFLATNLARNLATNPK